MKKVFALIALTIVLVCTSCGTNTTPAVALTPTDSTIVVVDSCKVDSSAVDTTVSVSK